jgi:hypothetical protein
MATTYATTQQVKDDFKSLDTTSPGAVVTDTKIDGWRDEAFAEINAAIGNKYALPIAAGSACLVKLRTIEIWLVKARIQSVIPVRTGADGAKQNDPPQDFRKLASAELKAIADGTLKMNGAVLASSADGVASFNVSHGTCHRVKKDTDQW